MAKYITKLINGEELYYLKDSEARQNIDTHEQDMDVHVTAAEKEYWNSKVNPPSYSAPTAKQLTYTGEPQTLLNAGSSTAGTIQYSIDQNEWSTDIPQATNAGTYYAYWRFVGEESIYVEPTAIEVIIEKANPAYTAPAANTLVYNGGSQELITEGSSSDGVFSYSPDGEEWNSAIPQGTDAIEYTVYWKFTGDANHVDIDATPITIHISKVTPTVSAPVAKIGLIYNATSQDLINAGSTNFGTLQYSLDNVNYGTSIPQGVNAVEYNVYYKVVGNSNINDVPAASITSSIAKVTPTVTAPTPKTLTFNGQAQELINAGSADFGTIQYKVGTDSWSTSIPTRTKGGSYTLSYKVVGDSNINDVPSESITCSISEKEITATVELSQTSYIYDGSEKTPSVTVKDGSVVVDPSEYSVTYSNNTNAGTATVSIYDNDGGDYNVIGSATFTITKAGGNVTTAPTAKSLTYSGSAQTLANAGSGTGTMYYSLSETSDFSTTIPTGTNAGSYIVYYYAAESANYNQSATGSVSVTIAKANGNVTTAPTAKSLTYNGEAQTLANAGSGTGTMYYSLNSSSDFSTTIPTGTNATSYTVYYYAAESSNYNQSATGNISVSIAKADTSYTAPTAKALTYNGNAQALLNAGSVTGGTIQYSSNNSSWGSTIPSQTNAGSYTSYWRIVGDSNHNDKASANISTTIAKASQNAPTASGASVTYGNTATASASGGGGQGSIEWSNGNTLTGNVGSKTTKARWAGNTNYNASGWSNEVTLTITKASQSAPSASGSTVTYGSTAYASASGGGGQGSLEWSNGSSRSAVGSQSTQARWTGNSNYNASGWSNEVTLTVNKASQSAPTAYGATVNYGSTATATASGGGGQGSIEWSNGNTRTAVGSQTTKARWTGNGNYNASDWSNEVTLTVINPDYVDLGLPSGRLWAKGNIVKNGSSYKIGSESDYGAYFSWGNITPHFSSNGSTFDDGYSFDKNTYNSTPGKSVTSDIASNDSAHDAAFALLGSPWRLPTNDECTELCNNTDHESVTINGVSGRKFMKKSDHSVYLFIPYSGYGYSTDLNDRGTNGSIWQSTIYGSDYGRYLGVSSANVYPSSNRKRYYGCTVRAVR